MAEGLATSLAEGLRQELWLTPKPGLVDREDAGSHHDLSLPLMERSIALVEAYLVEVERSVEAGEPLERQATLARGAETRMAAELGTNTHKGAIFLGGLMLVARGRAGGDDEGPLRRALGEVAAEVARLRDPAPTHGQVARQRFQVGGILSEAADGMPALFDAALPAYRDAWRRGQDGEVASFAMLAALMRNVEDTTALHRCVQAGLYALRVDGARLAELLERGEHLPFLRQRNADYRQLHLTMGGVADLLGLAFGWLIYRGEF